MGNKKTLLILVLVFALLLGGAYVLYSRLGENWSPEQLATQPTEAPTTDTPATDTPATDAPETTLPMAPDFVVYDAAGTPVRLSSYMGKPIVVNFWASWCGPCKMEMPDFNEKYLALGDEVQFMMVNMTDGYRETVDKAAAFVADQGYSFPVFYDTESNAAMTYGASSLPTTYFIDAQGHAVARAVGAIDAATLQRGIDMILP